MFRFKTILWIALSLLIIAPNAHAQTSFADQLQVALKTVVINPANNYPGAILYMSHPHKGNWLGAAGVGNLQTGAPLSPDASFRAGSILKPFVAVTILQLVEEGKLWLDAPIAEVLPGEYKSIFANAGQITVRMLLNHSSGIAEWLTPSTRERIAVEPTRVWKISEFLERAAAQPANFAPGKGYHYSNTDYNLLGLILENVTRMSWRDAVTKRVIIPLGLKNTQLPAPGDPSMPEGFMHGYQAANGKMIDLSLVDPSMAGAAGGGALVTSVADLAQFWAELRTGKLFQKPETLNRMMTFINATGEGGLVGYGLGVEKYRLPGGLEVIGHLGGTAGYRSFTGYIPTLELSLALALNTQGDPSPLILAALKVASSGQR